MALLSSKNFLPLFTSFVRPLSTSIQKEKILIKGIELKERPVYLDFQATTPIDPRVLDSMLPYLTFKYGNPHSRTHFYGWESEEAVEKARQNIANLIGASPRDIIFTSGATESNNMALKGVARFYKNTKNHIITSQIEHKCILDSCRQLEEEGFDVTYLPVQNDGKIDLQLLEKNIKPSTSIISIMYVNNEIGVVQPIKEIGEISKKHNVFFHCDAAQALAKLPIDVEKMNINLMSLSSHKIYGPKGIGCLYVGRRPRVRLLPIINGGGQERGLRSGTLSPFLVVGFGEACRIGLQEIKNDYEHISSLYHFLLENLRQNLSHIYLNGPESLKHRYPGNLNISFAYVEGESLLMGLKEMALSSGSACTSATLEPSYVLRALGIREDLSHTSLRIGLGRFTTLQDVQKAMNQIIKQVQKLRDMSPLWEMVNEGINIDSIKWSN